MLATAWPSGKQSHSERSLSLLMDSENNNLLITILATSIACSNFNICHRVFREKGSTPWISADTSPVCQAHRRNSSTNTWKLQGSCLQRGTSGRAEDRRSYPAVYCWTLIWANPPAHPPPSCHQQSWLINKAWICRAVKLDLCCSYNFFPFFSPNMKHIYCHDFNTICPLGSAAKWWLVFGLLYHVQNSLDKMVR